MRAVFPNLRIVDASLRRGQPYALNTGAKNALGESIYFCYADDEVGPGWLATMGEALSKWDFVASRIDVHKLSPAWVPKTRNHSQAVGLQTAGELSYLPHAGGGAIGIKRWIDDAIGGFDEELVYLHDTDYCWKAQLKGVELHFVSDAVMHVRLRDSLKGSFRQSLGWGQYTERQRESLDSLRPHRCTCCTRKQPQEPLGPTARRNTVL